MTSIVLATLALAGVANSKVEVVRSYDAPEATQGVAIDEKHFYAITNKKIGKYRKSDGVRIAGYEDPTNGTLVHMNGGVIHEGKLYGFHSNYPAVPMVSSIEVFETSNLKHLKSIPLGVTRGSLVWALPYKGQWLVCFGQYNGNGGEPGVPNTFSRIDVMDKDFHRVGGYGFSPKIVERWDGMTCSGAAIGPNGDLYATGHHAPEIHRLKIPPAGGVVELLEVIPSPCKGQGIDFEASTNTIWQIQRKVRKVYQMRVVAGDKSLSLLVR